jgi:hypothetical protein
MFLLALKIICHDKQDITNITAIIMDIKDIIDITVIRKSVIKNLSHQGDQRSRTLYNTNMVDTKSHQSIKVIMRVCVFESVLFYWIQKFSLGSGTDTYQVAKYTCFKDPNLSQFVVIQNYRLFAVDLKEKTLRSRILRRSAAG